MTYQRAFHLGRADTVTGNIHDVVDPPHDPVVAILVLPGVVTGQVFARHLLPIGLDKPFLVAPDAP